MGESDLGAHGQASRDTFQNWPRIIEERFCLQKPIDICEVKFRSTMGSRSLSPTAEDVEQSPSFECNFLSGKATKKYDKVIIKNCLQFFDESKKYFCSYITEFLRKPRPERAQQLRTNMLIIQRVCDLNTLPFHRQASRAWSTRETDYVDFMQTMQTQYFALRFDIEILK